MGLWAKYFGVQRGNATLNGSNVSIESSVLSLESFSIGQIQNAWYPKNTDFVKLQENNFILNNVISKIAKKFSGANFTDKTDSPLLQIINNPNNSQSKEEFLKEFATYIISSGFTVLWKQYKSYGDLKTLQLININPSKVEFNNQSLSFEYNQKKVTIKTSDAILFYDIRKNQDDNKGISRIIPLRSQIDNINLAQKAKNIQIQNSGTTIVSPKAVASNSNIDEGLNAPVPQMGGGIVSQKDEMEGKLNNRGLENRIIVSSKGLDAVNLSEKLNGIDFHAIIESDALAVYDAFGYPIELTPYGKNATFENKATATVSLIEEELLPLANNLVSSLNAEFKSTIAVDYNHLEAMSIVQNRIIDTNTKVIDQYAKLVEMLIISGDDFKKILINNNILDG